MNLKKIRHWFASRLGLGLGKSWYENNGCFKLKVGDKIRLKCRNSAGFGINPIGVIVGHEHTDKINPQDLYIIRMTTDDGPGMDFMKWIKNPL